MFQKHWLYSVFAGNVEKAVVLQYQKSNGLIMCSLKNVEKAMVLLCFRSNMLKYQWFYCAFCKKNAFLMIIIV